MKKAIVRVVSSLLCAALLSGNLPAIALAAATAGHIFVDTETGPQKLPAEWQEVSLQINPRYAGLISKACLQLPEGEVRARSIGSYGTEQEAVSTLRQMMVSRTETVALNVSCPTNTDVKELAARIFHAAIAHTGSSVQGDYLAWQYGGWRAGISHFSDGTNRYCTITYSIAYYTTAAQEDALNTRISQLLSQLNLAGKTDYEKVRTIYDHICSHVVYDYTNLNNTAYLLKYTAYAALVNGTAVCQGYANLLYRLCLEAGVDCRLIPGTAGGAHAWNIIRLGDYYYNADSTWDAGRSRCSYFLKCPDNFTDHVRNSQYDSAEFHAAYPMDSLDYTPGCLAGSCGENMTWAFNNGILTIRGTGAMDHYSDFQKAPWHSVRDFITSIIIEPGITRIGDHAFYECSRQITVNYSGTPEQWNAVTMGEHSLPPMYAVVIHGAEAARPTGIQTILPRFLTTIEAEAFMDSTAIASVEIPGTVTAIEAGAFKDCSALTVVVFDGNAPTIAADAFAGVTATVCYPAEDTTWTAGTMQSYGGNLTWIAYVN